MNDPTFEVNDDLERQVFRSFAEAHPHEAADLNWEEFMKMVWEVNPSIPEDRVRELLEAS